jgi:transposase
MSYWAEVPEPREQALLIPVRLDEAVPPEHPVRLLDEIMHRMDWRAFEARYHGRLGQPPIHPRVIASVLIYGMWTGLRSSRRLEEALHMRFDFRWLAEGRRIDHSTLSEFRRQHSEELKGLFIQVGLLARELGLLEFHALGFDGTRERANNRRSGTRTLEQLRQEREELAARFEDYLKRAAEEEAQEDDSFRLRDRLELPRDLRDARQRLKKLDAALEKCKAAESQGAAPKRIPVTDLDARVMPNKEGGHAPNYTPTAMVEIASGLVLCDDVLAEINEDNHLIENYDAVQQRFALTTKPALLADGLMATGANIAACEARGIDFYSPAPLPEAAANPALRDDPSQPVAQADWDRLPTHPATSQGESRQQLDKAAFVYDEAQNCYWCPAGQRLTHTVTTTEASRSGRRIRMRYEAQAASCQACPLRSRCVMGKAKSRQINREQYEAHRQRHALRMATPEAQARYAQRRHAGERPFAVIKQQFGMRQFLLRGLRAVRDEWRWAVTAFNLQRIINLLRSRAGPAASLASFSPSP